MSNERWVDAGYACRTCGLGLNEWFDQDGVMTFAHARSWEDHGHDPVPVPSSQAANRVMVCDFCGQTGADWYYHGRAMRPTLLRDDVVGKDIDGLWACCNACDPFVRRNDIDGLWKRYEQADASRYIDSLPSHQMTPEKRDAQGRMQRQMWSTFMASITLRERIPPQKVLPPARAAQMPKIRDKLVELWRTDLIGDSWKRDIETTGFIQLPGCDAGFDSFGARVSDLTDDIIARSTSRVTTGLLNAELYYVSAEFSHLAVQAGRKLPDQNFTAADLPSPNGLIIWQIPIYEVQVSDRHPACPVSAVSWTLVPQGVWINIYGAPEAVFTGTDPEMIRREIGWYLPWSSGGGAAFGSDLPTEQGILRTLLATWLLMRQPGMATQTPETIHADIRRRYKRANRPAPQVHVVNLRRVERPARAEQEQGTRTYTKGWVVGLSTGGFWRDYHTGAGRVNRERRFILPYVARGDLPLAGTEPVPTVKVLR